ncbi:MAG TPA: SRPBCC domain-containing protein [Pseudonocardia sp.]|jgi:hypothetical protein|nr:SRPBCC domain-containing protein [Pseudonocardia sp.]
MRQYESSVLIEASPEAVWAVLADASQYPAWDSGVSGVDGDIVDGGKIVVRTGAPSGRAFPVLVALDPPRMMVWTGGLPLGLFRGVRTFSLDDAPGGATLFTLHEEFSGPLLGLVRRTPPDLGPSSDRFTRGLKARVEGRSDGT